MSRNQLVPQLELGSKPKWFMQEHSPLHFTNR